MVHNQMKRSDETKKIILKAAGKLFSTKGYDSVTMRGIAKEAGCSHTTIYLYFKDKVSLLHELSMAPLQELHQQFDEIAQMDDLLPLAKLKNISREYIYFCLKNRSMYDIFINAKSTRVDENEPELEINKWRLDIFEILKAIIQECLLIPKNDQLLAFTRIFFYNLNGVLTTYAYPHESIDVLMRRLTPTFDLAVEVLILGFKETLKQAGEV